MERDFSRQSFKKTNQILNYMKILLVGGELFHAHGRTDGRTSKQT